MKLNTALLSLALLGGLSLSASPNFDIDGIAIDPSDPRIGVPIQNIVGSKWFWAFEDLYLPLSDRDYNDKGGTAAIYDGYVDIDIIGGLSAHQHLVWHFSGPNYVTVALTDLNTLYTSFTGTKQALVECVSGCADDSVVPEPGTLGLAGAALLMVVAWGSRRIHR